MKTITTPTLKSKMKYYFDLISQSNEIIVIPRNNHEDDGIVLMSMSTYKSLNENNLDETEYLFSTAKNKARLEESIQQLHEGKTKKYDLTNKIP